MSLKTPAGASAPEATPSGDGGASDRRRMIERVARLLFGLVVLVAIVAILARALRPELEGVGRAFVARFGLAGMAFGTFLADGFHFPVPPQFYMLMAIAAGGSPVPALAVITAASLCGGTVGYTLARRVSHWRFIARLLAKSAPDVERFGAKHGYRAAVLVSLTPLAFSVLCYLAGVYRFPKRIFAVLAILRVPKVLLYFYLVKLGWGM